MVSGCALNSVYKFFYSVLMIYVHLKWNYGISAKQNRYVKDSLKIRFLEYDALCSGSCMSIL